MQFGGFLGNEQLKQRLQTAFAKNQVSHCYLIVGPKGSGKRTLAVQMAAALQCVGEHPPCHSCPQCHKALSGTHPDVIWVDDPDHVSIPVEKVRQTRADAFIRPNEGRKKIYIFPQAQKLNPAGQNALLKLIEEPPSYGVFLLLCDNADKLLATVRSRCVELHLSALKPDLIHQELVRRFPQASGQELQQAIASAGGNLGQAIDHLSSSSSDSQFDEPFAAALAANAPLMLLALFSKLEKLGRDPFCAVLQSWQSLLYEAVSQRAFKAPGADACRALCQAKTTRELLHAYHTIQAAIEACRANVGVGHLCGALSVQLRHQ